MKSRVSEAGFSAMFRRRTLMLCVFFALWALAAVLRTWYIAGPGRDRFIAVGERTARRTFLLPAPRGGILDSQGVRLVWSERFYDLVALLPEGETLTGEELAVLAAAVPGVSRDSGVLLRGLAPGEVLALEKPLRSGAVRARIVPRDERMMIDSPAVRRLAGEVVRRDGVWRGVSGWEAKFDDELAGTPGSFTVLLDRRRNWIPATLRMLESPEPGRDVMLDRRLRELEE